MRNHNMTFQFRAVTSACARSDAAFASFACSCFFTIPARQPLLHRRVVRVSKKRNDAGRKQTVRIDPSHLLQPLEDALLLEVPVPLNELLLRLQRPLVPLAVGRLPGHLIFKMPGGATPGGARRRAELVSQMTLVKLEYLNDIRIAEIARLTVDDLYAAFQAKFKPKERLSPRFLLKCLDADGDW